LEPVEYLSGELPYDRTFSLCMAPPSFNGWPLTVQHHTSHPLRPQIHASDSEDDWLHDLPDEPLVAISLGTLWGTPALYETAARAALKSGARVVVATGLEVDVEHRRLTKVAWVSMDNLMARADVLVHHGGWGSTVAALASGTASVVIPMGADQFWNAQGIANTGAGVVAQKADAAETLQALIEESLGNPLYRLNAERLRSEIDAMPAPAEVVPLIERLAEDEVVFNKEAS
jgi:UDP:flavonoid glycosyltransferase YjiC (YdhE family)